VTLMSLNFYMILSLLMLINIFLLVLLETWKPCEQECFIKRATNLHFLY
jgi:hypothetical protein